VHKIKINVPLLCRCVLPNVTCAFKKWIPVKSPKRPMQSPSSCSQKSKVRLQIPASRCEACLSGGEMLLQHCPPKAEECGLPYCGRASPAAQPACTLYTGPVAPLFPVAVCSFSHSNVTCTTRSSQNESPEKRDRQPQQLRIHARLSPLSAPCAPYPHKSSS